MDIICSQKKDSCDFWDILFSKRKILSSKRRGPGAGFLILMGRRGGFLPDRGDWGAPRGSEVSELFSELEILISNQYFDKNLEYEDMVF